MISTTVLGMLVTALTAFITLDAAPLITGPSEAKNYLQKFNHMKTKNLKTGGLPTEEDFVAAIESFQSMAHLNITGELDGETIAVMNKPRCGVPDNMGFSNTARRKKRYNAIRRWAKSDLTWRINSYSPDLPDANIKTTMIEAFKAWSDVSQLSFEETSDTGADIIIDFAAGAHGDGDPFDGPYGVLAHAYLPSATNLNPTIAGDAHFDEDETWSLTNTGFNLFQVAAHEFGHSLGLGHSDVSGALMAPFYTGYVPNFVLHPDDVAGIQYLYGENTDKTMPPIVTEEGKGCPDTLDTIVRTADGRTFAFKGSNVYQLDDNGIIDGFPKPIGEVFPGLPDDLDAAFYYPNNGRTFFFKGSQYWRYRSTTRDSGYPRPISQWNGLPADIDSAFVWGPGNGRVFFTKGNQYYRYNFYYGRIDIGYPRPLSVWGFPSDVDHIDAAQRWENGRTYFYVDDVYYRYNDNRGRADDGYPRPTAYWWFGCGASAQEGPLEQQIATETMTTAAGGGTAVSVPNMLALVLTTVIALMYLI